MDETEGMNNDKATHAQTTPQALYPPVRFVDGYTVYLQIDHQGFAAVEDTTKKRADWYRDQIAIALERLIKDNCHVV